MQQKISVAFFYILNSGFTSDGQKSESVFL